MRQLLLALSLVFTLATAHAEIVRLAPDFTFPGLDNKPQSLKGLRGQPVVLIIAKSPKTRQLKEQTKNLKEIFQQFANKRVLFVAAFTGESGLVKSDIPFVIANNGPAVASAYGLQDSVNQGGAASRLLKKAVATAHGAWDPFNVVIIGRDGNIDYQTDQVLPSGRIRDIIQNSYAVQADTGR